MEKEMTKKENEIFNKMMKSLPINVRVKLFLWGLIYTKRFRKVYSYCVEGMSIEATIKRIESELAVEKMLGANFSGKVIVKYAPISKKYWTKGEITTIKHSQIKLGENWFEIDKRYSVKAYVQY